MMNKALKRKLEKIARGHLGMSTLDIRNSNRLDFYDVSVWGAQSALEAAYNLGKAEKIPTKTLDIHS